MGNGISVVRPSRLRFAAHLRMRIVVQGAPLLILRCEPEAILERRTTPVQTPFRTSR